MGGRSGRVRVPAIIPAAETRLFCDDQLVGPVRLLDSYTSRPVRWPRNRLLITLVASEHIPEPTTVPDPKDLNSHLYRLEVPRF